MEKYKDGSGNVELGTMLSSSAPGWMWAYEETFTTKQLFTDTRAPDVESKEQYTYVSLKRQCIPLLHYTCKPEPIIDMLQTSQPRPMLPASTILPYVHLHSQLFPR